MTQTKEKILAVALHLFATEGYEAVSVSQIAGEIGITKGALYRHYRNKRDIFDSILKRMEERDCKRAREYEMPEETAEKCPEAYLRTSLAQIKDYSKAMFRYWTEDPFSSDFRKLLTLEQYRAPAMMELHQKYLVSGPLAYMSDVFTPFVCSESEAQEAALRFYGPFLLLINVYDAAADKAAVLAEADRYIDHFTLPLVQNKTIKPEWA